MGRSTWNKRMSNLCGTMCIVALPSLTMVSLPGFLSMMAGSSLRDFNGLVQYFSKMSPSTHLRVDRASASWSTLLQNTDGTALGLVLATDRRGWRLDTPLGNGPKVPHLETVGLWLGQHGQRPIAVERRRQIWLFRRWRGGLVLRRRGSRALLSLGRRLRTDMGCVQHHRRRPLPFIDHRRPKIVSVRVRWWNRWNGEWWVEGCLVGHRTRFFGSWVELWLGDKQISRVTPTNYSHV